MKRLVFSVLAFSLILLGCASARSITGPDGTPHELVSCGVIEKCYDKAAEVCGGKYQIVNTTNQVYGNADYTSSQQQLLVKCLGR